MKKEEIGVCPAITPLVLIALVMKYLFFKIIAFFKNRMRAGCNPVKVRILLGIFLRVTHKKNRITL